MLVSSPVRRMDEPLLARLIRGKHDEGGTGGEGVGCPTNSSELCVAPELAGPAELAKRLIPGKHDGIRMTGGEPGGRAKGVGRDVLRKQQRALCVAPELATSAAELAK